MSSLLSDLALCFYGDADSSGNEMEEVGETDKRRVTRAAAKGGGEGGEVAHKQPRDQNGQYISLQQRIRELEKGVKDLERVASLAARPTCAARRDRSRASAERRTWRRPRQP